MENFFVERGAGEPLILLHGNGEDCSYFEHQMDALAAAYLVFAIDTRGHGRSPRGDAPFTIRQFADDLRDFMDSHSLERAHILGFSDGANIAMIFAVKYPERVLRLILNGGNLDAKGIKRSVQWPIELGYAIARMFAAKSPEAKANAEMLGLMVNDPDIEPSLLARIQAPTLVIAGRNDMVKESHTKLIARSIPNSTLCFIDGDHFIAHRNPEPFNKAVLEFLKADDRADEYDNWYIPASAKGTKPLLLLLPGLGVSYRIFLPLIALLENDFRVMAFQTDGFTLGRETRFTTVDDQARRVIDFIRTRCDGHVDCLYGLSLGGKIVSRVLERNEVRIDHAIMDAAPLLPLPRWLEGPLRYYQSFNVWTCYRWTGFWRFVFHSHYFDVLLEECRQTFPFGGRQAVLDGYKSVYTNKLESISGPDIHFWYGTKESFVAKPQADYLLSICPDVHIEVFKGMNHGQLLVDHPEEVAKRIKGMNSLQEPKGICNFATANKEDV